MARHTYAGNDPADVPLNDLGEAGRRSDHPLPAPMSQLDRDTMTAVCWLVEVAQDLLKGAIAHQNASDVMLNKVRTIGACANLPGDKPLRVRCTPHVFTFKC